MFIIFNYMILSGLISASFENKDKAWSYRDDIGAFWGIKGY